MSHNKQNSQNQKKDIPLSPAVQSAVNAFRSAGEETDPDGWYTGMTDAERNPKKGVHDHPSRNADHATPGATQFVQPTQDADDL